MPSSFNHWVELVLPHALQLLGILVLALIVNRLLRAACKWIIKKASAQTRQAQLREQQTSTLATILYSTGGKVVWAVARMSEIDNLAINILPAVTLEGLASLD